MVELHITVSNKKIFSIVQKRFFEEFMTPTTTKRIYVFM